GAGAVPLAASMVHAAAHAAEIVEARRLVEVGSEPDRRLRAQPQDKRAADAGDRGIPERRDERGEPSRTRHRIVVEERDQRAACGRQARVAAVGCTEPWLVQRAQRRAPPPPGRRAPGRGGAGGGAGGPPPPPPPGPGAPRAR